MKKFSVSIDACASITLLINAENIDDAEQMANEMVRDEDAFFKEHGKNFWLWNPTIEEICEEEEFT